MTAWCERTSAETTLETPLDLSVCAQVLSERTVWYMGDHSRRSLLGLSEDH